MSAMDKFGSENGMFSLERDRIRTPRLATQLSSMAMHQWEKALTGAAAMPAAAGLSVAAGATYGIATLERVFEVLESAMTGVGRRLVQDAAGGDSLRRERNGERAEAQ